MRRSSIEPRTAAHVWSACITSELSSPFHRNVFCPSASRFARGRGRRSEPIARPPFWGDCTLRKRSDHAEPQRPWLPASIPSLPRGWSAVRPRARAAGGAPPPAGACRAAPQPATSAKQIVVPVPNNPHTCRALPATQRTAAARPACCAAAAATLLGSAPLNATRCAGRRNPHLAARTGPPLQHAEPPSLRSSHPPRPWRPQGMARQPSSPCHRRAANLAHNHPLPSLPPLPEPPTKPAAPPPALAGVLALPPRGLPPQPVRRRGGALRAAVCRMDARPRQAGGPAGRRGEEVCSRCVTRRLLLCKRWLTDAPLPPPHLPASTPSG
jgi:hypothetical protein